MKKEVEVVFFDLFLTLVQTVDELGDKEHEYLGISSDEWTSSSQNPVIYSKRATSKTMTPEEIIIDILEGLSLEYDSEMVNELSKRRINRFHKAVTEVEDEILEVLDFLKEKGIKLCLISNCDVIDVRSWNQSILSKYFDHAIFSYQVGYIKPSREIYEIALETMEVTPDKCVFIGDGGSNELIGAKKMGMKTILTQHFKNMRYDNYVCSMEYIDYTVNDFGEIKSIISDNTNLEPNF